MATLYTNIINIEGGYENDPSDRGGETKYGITKRDFPELDIANLTVDQALEIYRIHYWDVNRLSEISTQVVANVIFLMVVNHGNVTGIRIVQEALNNCGSNIAVDGKVGIVTLTAINGSNQKWLVDCIRLAQCRRYLRIVDNNKTQNKFFKGWIRRALM